MRWGLVFWGLLIVVAVGAIVALCLRPATVIGVSEKSLAHSVRGDDSVGAATCQEIENDERFVCTVDFGDSPPSGLGKDLKVEIDDFGCWESTNRAPSGEALDGCITITDLIGAGD